MGDKIQRGPKLKHSINSSMGEFFFKCAERFSDRICQIDASSDTKETYQSVKKRSVRVALELLNRGVTSDDVVVLCTKITLDNVIPIISTFFIGAKIANLDPTLSARHTTHLLTLVSPKIIFVEEESVSLIEDSLKCANLTADIVVFGKSLKYPTFDHFAKPKPNENTFEPRKVNISDTSIIFFSSGTTGLPKAICHSHSSFLHVAHAFHQSGGNCDSILSFTSFYWVSGLILLSTSFISGGHRIFCGPIDAEKTFQVIEKYKVTFMFLAPILTYKLTNFEKHQNYDTSSLSSMLVGGTPISTAQFQRLTTVFKHTNVVFVYGLTEAGIVTLFDPKDDHDLIKTQSGSCGKAAPGMEIKVVDIETGLPLGPKLKGEVRVKSPTLMKGYYKAESSSAFDSDGFLETGDIGYYNEKGCFYVIERLKEMFKYLSWHVVPSAIEAVLLEHPAIKEAVVFGIPQSEEEGELPAACVVLKENCNVNKQQIEEFVAGRVSDYEKLRGGVFFAEALQKTPSGKLMRKEIKNAIMKTL
ncbi:4-coumarate--CoA ligase 1-like [Tribolium madens]|uniref:4-coumarate--CoA ligase 1-like n=1 Tax=Tribolium madens TaxID=41895 RepID=UPI001CF7347B|nr:4-coumarate--CoA ligase 1-like [Tribolium madens]